MTYLKVEVFLPEEAVPELIEALNQHGLLGQGAYDYVYASSIVLGHWRPLEGSNPAIGSLGDISVEKEIKLEFRILNSERELAERLIRQHHPYEEPAINFILLQD